MGWKWKKWKDMIPYTSCLCFGRKQWQPINDDDEGESSRRGGVSFEKTDKNAMYVRMLGDVKMKTKGEYSRDRRRGSLQDAEHRILEALDVSDRARGRYGLKFQSMQCVRRRRKPLLRCADASILDDYYGGQAGCLLSTVGDWDFNIFTLDKLSNGRPLFHVCLHLFQEYNLIDIFQLDIVKLMRCFTLIEEGYHNQNPYHNVVHAADVTQAMHCYLKEGQIGPCLNPLEIMVSLLSAATHDLDHPGVNQAFLIATSNHLAALYKNSSVLENHHWRSAIGILKESRVFDHLDTATWQTIEWQLKSLILATDITRQQEFLTRLKRHNDIGDFNLRDEENRHFMLQIGLKCADICNPCRPWKVSKRWSEMVCQEFFNQGDTERKLQLSVTPLCDRYKTTVAKIQSGFMQFVVKPLFTEWCRFMPSSLSQKMLANIQSNKASWDVVISEAEAAAAEKKEKEEETQQQQAQEPVRRILDDSDLSSEDENRCPPQIESVQIHPLPRDIVINSKTFVEETSIPASFQRRHSMPMPMRTKEFGALLQPHRESLPKVLEHKHIKRRHSLPTKSPPLNGTSIDKLADKLSQVAEAGSVHGSNSTLSSTIENLMVAAAGNVSPRLSDVELEGLLYKSLNNRRKSEPERFYWRRASDTDYLFAQLQRASRLGRPAWKENTLSDVEQAAMVRNLFNRRGSNGSLRTHSSNFSALGRQVLRPLNGNSRVAPLNGNRPFSPGNENYVLSENSSGITTIRPSATIIHDRPRSFSLDARLAEVQPQLLQRLHEHLSGEDESYTESHTSHDIEEDSEHIDTSSALYEDDVTSLTAPLLTRNRPNLSLRKE